MPLTSTGRAGGAVADAALALYDGAWNGDASRAFKDFAY
jgi:gamma-glutamylcysteine synthetase